MLTNSFTVLETRANQKRRIKEKRKNNGTLITFWLIIAISQFETGIQVPATGAQGISQMGKKICVM